MRLNRARRDRSALDFVVDLGVAGLGVWLVLGGMGMLATVLFVGANLATLFLFRNPLRKDLRVHTQPWQLPVGLVFFSALFAWPALHLIGLERTVWALINLAVLIIVRALMMVGAIGGGQPRS